MKNYKKILFLLIISLIFCYIIINNSIENNKSFIEPIKKFIPLNVKNFLLDTVFIFKTKNILETKYKEENNKIIIRTNDFNSFELKKESKIYVYSNQNYNRIVIYGYNILEGKITCLKENF